MEIRKIFGKERAVEKVAICLFNKEADKPELYTLKHKPCQQRKQPFQT